MMSLSDFLPIAGKVLVAVLVVNAVLSGLKLALDKLQSVVKSPEIDAADTVVGKILDVLSKVADFLSANLPH